MYLLCLGNQFWCAVVNPELDIKHILSLNVIMSSYSLLKELFPENAFNVEISHIWAVGLLHFLVICGKHYSTAHFTLKGVFLYLAHVNLYLGPVWPLLLFLDSFRRKCIAQPPVWIQWVLMQFFWTLDLFFNPFLWFIFSAEHRPDSDCVENSTLSPSGSKLLWFFNVWNINISKMSFFFCLDNVFKCSNT